MKIPRVPIPAQALALTKTGASALQQFAILLSEQFTMRFGRPKWDSAGSNSWNKEVIPMTIDTVQEPESDQFSIPSPREAPLFSFEAEVIDIVALRLWQRGSCLEMTGDECWFCKGEAQRCLARCQ